MEQQILKLIEILFGIGLTAVTPYAVKALIAIQQKAVQEFGEKNVQIIEAYAAKVVAAVAQRYGTLENEEKFAKAISLLEAKFGMNFLSESELEVLIEDAVAQLKIAQGQVISQITTNTSQSN
jgi:DNA replication protein DnaD